jgi:hypothetical protein
MGGGEALDYEKYITFRDEDPTKSYPNFYIDYKNGGHFESERKDIFHYCIMVDNCWADSGSGFNGDRAGRGETGGDDFVVCSSQSKYTFMHELGHNLDLSHSMRKDGSFPYSEYATKGGAKRSVMYYISAQASRGYTYDRLWKYIDLQEVIDPVD